MKYVVYVTSYGLRWWLPSKVLTCLTTTYCVWRLCMCVCECVYCFVRLLIMRFILVTGLQFLASYRRRHYKPQLIPVMPHCRCKFLFARDPRFFIILFCSHALFVIVATHLATSKGWKPEFGLSVLGVEPGTSWTVIHKLTYMQSTLSELMFQPTELAAHANFYVFNAPLKFLHLIFIKCHIINWTDEWILEII